MTDLILMQKNLLADTETPVSAYMKLCGNSRDTFLFESGEKNDVLGRHSIVAWDPICSVTLEADGVEVDEAGDISRYSREDFFPQIRKVLARMSCQPESVLPLVGSFVGYLGWDTVRLIERLPGEFGNTTAAARLCYPSRFLVFDHIRRVMSLVVIAATETDARKKMEDAEKRLRQALPTEVSTGSFKITPPPRDRYIESVKRAREYILDGDIFQVVLSDRFSGQTDLDPLSVYRWLRVASPSPYMFYMNLGDHTLVGASPETLVKVENGVVGIRPIAGTRGRSADPMRDRELEQELMASEKERAEHLMLVDLARNDVGRVSKVGSVSLDPFMNVERYSHVMHIVSQVNGKLRDNVDAIDALCAGFPAGTLSGAPKVRAMEIIHELESRSRGPYGGGVGWIGAGSRLDTCIAIRMIQFMGDEFNIQVGAGIVADSIPEMEYREIEQKAAQSLAALDAAAKGEMS